VFLLATLPQFLDAAPGLFDAKLIWLGTVFMFMTFAVFAVYAYASAAFRALVPAAPVARRWVERTLGTFLIGFAAKLVSADRLAASLRPTDDVEPRGRRCTRRYRRPPQCSPTTMR
jgi:threonine/homoserine/homoserine lactone efflux protein